MDKIIIKILIFLQGHFNQVRMYKLGDKIDVRRFKNYNFNIQFIKTLFQEFK